MRINGQSNGEGNEMDTRDTCGFPALKVRFWVIQY